MTKERPFFFQGDSNHVQLAEKISLNQLTATDVGILRVPLDKLNLFQQQQLATVLASIQKAITHEEIATMLNAHTENFLDREYIARISGVNKCYIEAQGSGCLQWPWTN